MKRCQPSTVFLIKHNEEHDSNHTKSILREFTVTSKLFHHGEVEASTDDQLDPILLFPVCNHILLPLSEFIKLNSKLFTESMDIKSLHTPNMDSLKSKCSAKQLFGTLAWLKTFKRALKGSNTKF